MIFDRLLEHMARGHVDFDTDVFRASLHTSDYTPDKGAHDYFNDVTNEVVGAGYTAGGNIVTVGVALDTVNHRLDITLGGSTWPTSSITARKAVYRKSRGGVASADELIGVNDFGSNYTSTAGLFTLNPSTYRTNNLT